MCTRTSSTKYLHNILKKLRARRLVSGTLEGLATPLKEPLSWQYYCVSLVFESFEQ